jgi:hypothetical protein
MASAQPQLDLRLGLNPFLFYSTQLKTPDAVVDFSFDNMHGACALHQIVNCAMLSTYVRTLRSVSTHLHMYGLLKYSNPFLEE